MLKKKEKYVFLPIICCIFIFCFIGFCNPVYASFNEFVTRSGDKLMEGNQEFRFISINTPNSHIVEDHSWHKIDPYEQEDIVKTISQMGGGVLRIYTFSIKDGKNNGTTGPCHIQGPRQYNEDLFRDLDKLLQLCNQYNVRVIIPFIDRWEWWGGIKQFSALRGKSELQFYTNSTLKDDYKHLVSYLLNRTNYYTGVQYKNDKAILAWETGNELNCPDSWTNEMAEYIKSIDQNHLFLDGKYGISNNSLNNPNVDIVSNHYYEANGRDYAARCNSDKNSARGKKPFIVGEFGLTTTTNMHNLLDTVITNNTSGAMLWSLRYHCKEGGFYWQNPNNTSGAYHWPGFDSGNSDEKNVMNLIYTHSYEIKGIPVPQRPIPEAPSLLPISTVTSISWRGSVGAEKYDLERATDVLGPWTLVGSDLVDSNYPYHPFNDISAPSDILYYRIKAKNASGVSEPSNIMTIDNRYNLLNNIVDDINDFSKVYSHTSNLEFDSTNSRYFNGDTSRLIKTDTNEANVVYYTQGDMVGFSVNTYFWPYDGMKDFEFYVSTDGTNYEKFTPAKRGMNSDWQGITNETCFLPQNIHYLKITFNNDTSNCWGSQLSKVKITYSNKGM